MKPLNLCLVILNIISFPTLASAHLPENVEVDTPEKLINLIHSNSNLVKDESETEIIPKTDTIEPDKKIENSEENPAADKTTEDLSVEEPEPEIKDEDLEENSDSEEKEQVKKPTPEEIARLEKLAAADKLYLAGDKKAAVKLYRQAKPPWAIEKQESVEETKPTPFNNPGQLSPAGRVFWRNYQRGKEQGLETKTLSALKLLTTRESQFIPGHIYYADTLQQYERSEESTKALNRAIRQYPNEPELLRAKMNADIAEDKWLDASIMARQFSLFNPDSPNAEEFNLLANQYLAKYQSNLRSSIRWNAVGNAIAGTIGFALTGNLFGPLSALQTTSTLLKGESAVGESSVKEIKKQVPFLEEKEVVAYVNKIGQKVSAAAGRDEFKYEFYLIMDDDLNAFALPGGKIFVNAGAIMQTDSEAELAGLLAHEVSHSALSHGFQLVTKGNLTSNVVSYIPYVGNTASSLLVLNYSRGMEKQADIFGTRILLNAGYAADGVRNLMAQLNKSKQDKDNPEPPAWISTHPNSKQRIRYMEQLIVDNNLNRYSYEGVARHQEIKEIVTKKWQEYNKCIEDVETIKEAKKCAGNKEKSDKLEAEIEQDSEVQQNESEKNEREPEIKQIIETENLGSSETDFSPDSETKIKKPDAKEPQVQNSVPK